MVGTGYRYRYKKRGTGANSGHEKTDSDRTVLQRMGRARRVSQEKRRYLAILRRLSEIECN